MIHIVGPHESTHSRLACASHVFKPTHTHTLARWAKRVLNSISIPRGLVPMGIACQISWLGCYSLKKNKKNTKQCNIQKAWWLQKPIHSLCSPFTGDPKWMEKKRGIKRQEGLKEMIEIHSHHSRSTLIGSFIGGHFLGGGGVSKCRLKYDIIKRCLKKKKM